MTILTRRVISIFNKKTSMRLAQNEWIILQKICQNEKIARKKLFEMIEQKRDKNLGLTAAVRLFALLYLFAKATKISHKAKNIENILNDM